MNLLVLLIVLISHMSIQITSVKVEVLQTNWLWSEGLEVSVLNQSGGWSESKKNYIEWCKCEVKGLNF